MKLRLLTLTKAEVQTIVDNTDLVLFDDCNYRDGKFCPLAIALGAHTLPNPSQELVEKIHRRMVLPGEHTAWHPRRILSRD